MNYQDYQERALTTALPTALNETYLANLILGEIGEVYGAHAKAIRDQWSPEQLRDALIKEYGDIAWGIAVYAHLTNSPGLIEDTAFDPGDYSAENALQDLLVCWSGVREGTHMLCYGLAELAVIAEHDTDVSFKTILETNLEKLASRQARGVIAGSGDNR